MSRDSPRSALRSNSFVASSSNQTRATSGMLRDNNDDGAARCFRSKPEDPASDPSCSSSTCTSVSRNSIDTPRSSSPPPGPIPCQRPRRISPMTPSCLQLTTRCCVRPGNDMMTDKCIMQKGGDRSSRVVRSLFSHPVFLTLIARIINRRCISNDVVSPRNREKCLNDVAQVSSGHWPFSRASLRELPYPVDFHIVHDTCNYTIRNQSVGLLEYFVITSQQQSVQTSSK